MKLLILAAFALSVAGSGFAPAAEWEPKQFPISFWCGPPDSFITVERYKEVSQAGFNYLMPPCEGRATVERNYKILDTARETGLKAFISDERMPLSITGVADAKSRLDAIVRDYAKHTALAGYFLTDEPGEAAFPGLGEVVAYLREIDPKHPAYINLFPNYASAEQLGVPTYTRYLSDFRTVVQPFVISYDHYHFLKGSDRPTFFSNLSAVRTASRAADVPFWQIVLSIPHGPYRSLTEAEKRWEAFQTLAYGGKGVLYFTYWQPADKSFDWGPPIILKDGTRTPQYEEVKRINHEVQAVGKYLLTATPGAVTLVGEAPGDDGKTQQIESRAGVPVRVSGPAPLTIGTFLRDTHIYVLVANRDYKKPVSADSVFTSSGKSIEVLDKQSGKWSRLKVEVLPEGDRKSRVEIAAGDGELYRW